MCAGSVCVCVCVCVLELHVQREGLDLKRSERWSSDYKSVCVCVCVCVQGSHTHMSGFLGGPGGEYRASDWGGDARAGGMMDTHGDMMDTHGMLLGLTQDPPYSDPDYLDPGYTDGDEPAARTRPSTRSRSGEVTELEAQEVRWFYREDKRSWKPFVGHDSLKIERAHRAVCALRDAREGVFEPQGREGVCEGVCDGQGVCKGVCEEDGAVESVCVRGGLYEVDVKEKECYPVYWNQQERIPVMRAQWFTDGTWLPLDEEDGDLIELEHLAKFRGHRLEDSLEPEGVSAAPESKEVVHSVKLSRSHVDWHSVDEVYLYSDATTSKIARSFTQKLGFSKASSSGTRLHRGYVEEAALEDTPPAATHIVFVVHGIGQKMDQGRIIRNTSMMRDAARKMAEKHFSDRTTEHVEFLPVEWRSKLSLDGDTVDSITPDKVRGLRDMLNSSAMDIMYYTSPLYRDEITRGLTSELNRLYTLFCSRNPEFEETGRVSIVSHSLGCVITYDIITGFDPVRLHHQEAPVAVETEPRWCSSREQRLLEELQLTRTRLRNLEDQFQSLKSSRNSPALKFKVENFFCMGSPLAVFLALRGVRPGSCRTQNHILPRSICTRLFNIFHPTDPVAYRLEPLILKHYSNISPVQIHWYNTSSPTPYDEVRPVFLTPLKECVILSEGENTPSPCTSPPPQRRMGGSITNLGRASIMGAASIGKGIGGILFSRFSRSSGQVGGADEEPINSEAGPYETEGGAVGEEGGVTETEDKVEEKTERENGMSQSTSTVMDNSTLLELDRRIDFELREGLVESRYWSAVTSHTAYWCSYDVALFLLTFMYSEDTTHGEEEDTAES
ncbi:phospholipase DDHD1b [Clarias gariepinus]|uniref:phospholipase DDHD1b n=1 Tax=Clarias gariepinus TaxID=13013 RepID=UPI00234C398B|nr:phospholipase DDHD1b [Clarias gariepinus]